MLDLLGFAVASALCEAVAVPAPVAVAPAVVGAVLPALELDAEVSAAEVSAAAALPSAGLSEPALPLLLLLLVDADLDFARAPNQI